MNVILIHTDDQPNSKKTNEKYAFFCFWCVMAVCNMSCFFARAQKMNFTNARAININLSFWLLHTVGMNGFGCWPIGRPLAIQMNKIHGGWPAPHAIHCNTSHNEAWIWGTGPTTLIQMQRASLQLNTNIFNIVIKSLQFHKTSLTRILQPSALQLRIKLNLKVGNLIRWALWIFKFFKSWNMSLKGTIIWTVAFENRE